MTLPTSTRFDIIDFNHRASSNGEGRSLDNTIFGDAFVRYPNVVLDGEWLAFVADTANGIPKRVETSMVIEDALDYTDPTGSARSGIPASYSFEFDISLTNDIPKDFSNPEHRLFVGAMNRQGYSAGLLFSHQGIALADSPNDPSPNILGGGLATLVDSTLGGSFYEEGTNFRLVVNGELGRVSIYAIDARLAYDSGSGETNAPVIFSAAAKPTNVTTGDSVVISGFGDTASKQLADGKDVVEEQDVLFAVRSIRLASSVLIPEDAPVSVAESSQAASIGSAEELTGINSYDPEGREITYNWEIEIAPEGSTMELQGASNSVSNLQALSDYDGSAVDVVRLRYYSATARANSFSTYVEAGDPGEHLSTEFDDATGILRISLAVDGNGDVVTTASDIVSAFSNRLSPGYNIQLAGGTDPDTGIEYPQRFRGFLIHGETAGDETIQVGSYEFSGGNGSPLANPRFIADKEGVYVVSLQVSNGRRKSRITRVTFQASLTTQLLSHRPHSQYIFKYLSDFWSLVKDKDQIESIWSSVTQILSNEMLQGWQNDYGKSLQDISRKYQRRWLNYPMLIEVDDTVATTLNWQTRSVKELAVPLVQEGSKSKFAEGAVAWNSPVSTGLKLVMSSLGQPYVVDVVTVTPLYELDYTQRETVEISHHCEGLHGMVTRDEVRNTDVLRETGYYRVISAGTDFGKYGIISERSSGYFVADPSATGPGLEVLSSVMTDKTYPLFQINDATDVIRLRAKSSTVFCSITERDVGGVPNTARLVDLDGTPLQEGVSGIPAHWEHLREASNVFLHTVPYLTLADDFSVESADLIFGDSVCLTFIDPYINTEVTKEVALLASHGNHLFVDWQGLLDYFNDQAARHNYTTEFTYDDLINIEFRIDSFYRNRVLEKVDDLVSAPKIGFNTIVPEYVEGIDYVITDGVVSFTDYFVGSLETKKDSSVVKFLQGYKRHQEIMNSGFDLMSIVEAGVHAIQIESGADAGLYLIQSIDEESGAITLDRPLTSDSSASVFRAPVFCAYHRPPSKLWSEVSYFDNWQTVQNNFGLFVGLPKELVDSYDPTLDYLSVIKSMWFAFLNGPSFDNMTLAIQSLFGLPYTETACQLTYHEEATPEADGTLLLVSEDSRVTTYTYPYGAELSLNPLTGRKIKPHKSVTSDEIAAMSTQERLDLNDSVLGAYVRLVDVVKMDDYVSDPTAISHTLGRNDRQLVDGDGGTRIVDVSPSLVEKYHTFLIDVPLSVSKGTSVFPLISDFLQEAKPAYTNFILQGSFHLFDEINVVDSLKLLPTVFLKDTPHTSPFFSLPQHTEAYTWPVAKTKEKFEIDYSLFLDAADFCLSGPYCRHEDIHLGISRLVINESVIGAMPGTVLPGQEADWNPIVERVLKFTGGGIAFAIPGTGDYEMYSFAGWSSVTQADPITGGNFIVEIRISLGQPDHPNIVKLPVGALAPYNSLNCLFFTPDNWPPPQPVITHWDDQDVKEKYESGYCEGVLDDYSGDGSWNMRRGKLDMVNTVNSDIDVVRTRMWVPIEHRFFNDEVPGDIRRAGFIEGETISLIDENGDVLTGTLWDDAPPVVHHVGYGQNVKLPDMASYEPIYSNTVKSYLILSFEIPREALTGEIISTVEASDLYDYAAAGLSNYGHEGRLNVLAESIPLAKRIRGNRSGAQAHFTGFEPAGLNTQTLEETIWQVDKLIENGPASDPTLTVTTYVPVGGMTITDFRNTSPVFDTSINTYARQYSWEAQRLPLDVYPPIDPDQRMQPSFNPGFFTDWDLGGLLPDDVNIVYGNPATIQNLWVNPTPITDFAFDPTRTGIENVHIGMTISARKEHHATHGFTNFRIPSPSIKMILPSSAGYDLRICGFYFCNDDPTRVVIPTDDPQIYGNPDAGEGIIGGSWVFFRNSVTLEEFADVDWEFETGINAGLPVLPREPLRDGGPAYTLGGADQRSDGHIIECHIPELPSEGYYDIIIRNYRPHRETYNFGDPHTWTYHMDEVIAHRAYYHAHDGRGGPAWGTTPFGTGGAS